MGDGTPHRPKIRWAPKVRPEKIRQLYAQDARGAVDEVLLDDVGLALYLRCESIVLASTGRVKCPACGAIVPVKTPDELRQAGAPAERVARCPRCDWSTTVGEWGTSWRHRELHAGWGLPAIEAYRDRYLQATTSQGRMLLIDQLLHAFHQDLRRAAPHRSVAHNLVEGNHRQALALLDELAYGEASTPGLRGTYAAWRAAAEGSGRLPRQRAGGPPP
jgi:hypothetical protein